MFDRPEWWQVLILITPLSVAIYGLRWWEYRKANTAYRELTPTQKGYALLHYLPPGVSALFYSRLQPEEQSLYREAGQQIRGTGRSLVAPLVKEVLKKLTADGCKPPSTESSDPLEKLHLAADFCQEELFQLLRQHFPPRGA